MTESVVLIVSLVAIVNLSTLSIVSFFKIRQQQANFWMGLMFLFAGLAMLNNLLIFMQQSSTIIYHLSLICNVSYGAALILFVRSLRGELVRFRTNDYWLFLPSILYVPFIVYTLFNPQAMQQIMDWAAVGKMTLESAVFNLVICFYSIGANSWMLVREWHYPDTSTFRSETLRKTRRELLLVMLMLQLFAFVPFILGLNLRYIILYMPIFGQIYYIYMLFKFSRINWKEAIEKETNYRKPVKPLPEVDFHKSEKLLKQIQTLMEVEKPYLNAGFSLKEMAEVLNVKPAILSSVVRERLKLSFSDFVNSYRVRYAVERIQNKKQLNLTLEMIMYESGYNNRTSFYLAVMKHTGKKPSDFVV